MGIEKIADGIEQAKLGYMEAVCGAAERAKAEIKAANGDRSRSGSWARERILGVVEAYEAERVKMAGEVMSKLKGAVWTRALRALPPSSRSSRRLARRRICRLSC